MKDGRPDRIAAEPHGASPFTEREIAQRVEHFATVFLAGESSDTVGTYQRCLVAFLDWVSLQGGHCSLSRGDVEAYCTFLVQERGILPVSLATYITALRSFCYYLTTIGVLRYNPVEGFKGPSRPSSHSREVLTHTEVNHLIASIDDEDRAGKRDRAMIHLMANAGLSGIEVVRAEAGDLEQTLYGHFLYVQGKGRSEKDQRVTLDTAVLSALESHLNARRPGQARDPIFVSHTVGRRNARLSTRGLRSCLYHRLVAAGLKRGGVSARSWPYAAPLIWLS